MVENRRAYRLQVEVTVAAVLRNCKSASLLLLPRHTWHMLLCASEVVTTRLVALFINRKVSAVVVVAIYLVFLNQSCMGVLTAWCWVNRQHTRILSSTGMFIPQDVTVRMMRVCCLPMHPDYICIHPLTCVSVEIRSLDDGKAPRFDGPDGVTQSVQ